MKTREVAAWQPVLCAGEGHGLGIEKRMPSPSAELVAFDDGLERFLSFPTSDRTRLPAEFKHITKRRKRN